MLDEKQTLSDCNSFLDTIIHNKGRINVETQEVKDAYNKQVEAMIKRKYAGYYDKRRETEQLMLGVTKAKPFCSEHGAPMYERDVLGTKPRHKTNSIVKAVAIWGTEEEKEKADFFGFDLVGK